MNSNPRKSGRVGCSTLGRVFRSARSAFVEGRPARERMMRRRQIWVDSISKLQSIHFAVSLAPALFVLLPASESRSRRSGDQEPRAETWMFALITQKQRLYVVHEMCSCHVRDHKSSESVSALHSWLSALLRSKIRPNGIGIIQTGRYSGGD